MGWGLQGQCFGSVQELFDLFFRQADERWIMCRIGVLQEDKADDEGFIDILIEPTLIQSNRRQGTQNNFGCVIQRCDRIKNPAGGLRQILVIPLGLK